MFSADNLGYFTGIKINDFLISVKKSPTNCSLAGYYSTFW